MKHNMRKQTALVRLLAALLLVGSLVVPDTGAAFAASGDPVLQFDLNTQNRTEGLRQGDQIKVEATVSRQDGTAEPYELYSVMLDIDFDNELFELSSLKNPGLKRPDGENWIGNWSCNPISGLGDSKRVRVLYTNIGGLMVKPFHLDQVSGELTVGSFVLTAKKDAPDVSTKVSVGYMECAGSDLKAGSAVLGQDLTLTFAAAGDNSSGGGNSSSGGSAGTDGSHSGDSSGSGSGGNSGGSSGSAQDNQNSLKNGTSGGKQALSFSDLIDVPADHWAVPYIRYLVEQGIVSGNEKREFQPENNVTRAEFAQMLAAAFGYSTSESAETFFFDVRPENWYFQPVMTLYRVGIVAGVGDGLYGAGETLSRQDMAVMLSKAMQDQNLILSMVRDYGIFADQEQVADYAQKALWDLYCTGVISGTSETTLSPEDSTTRAQVAAVLTNVLNQQKEGR